MIQPKSALGLSIATLAELTEDELANVHLFAERDEYFKDAVIQAAMNLRYVCRYFDLDVHYDRYFEETEAGNR